MAGTASDRFDPLVVPSWIREAMAAKKAERDSAGALPPAVEATRVGLANPQIEGGMALLADLQAAARHIELLTGSPDTPVTFQTFDDSTARRAERSAAKPAVKDPLATWRHGTLAQHVAWLTHMHGRGAGVYIMVNEGDGAGRAAVNVTRVRALVQDFDGKEGPDASELLTTANKALPFNFTVESSPNKWHGYWLVDDVPLADFGHLQRRLNAWSGGDKAVNDLPRVLRLAGFWHLKDPALPFQSTLRVPPAAVGRYAMSAIETLLATVEPAEQQPRDVKRARAMGGTAEAMVAGIAGTSPVVAATAASAVGAALAGRRGDDSERVAHARSAVLHLHAQGAFAKRAAWTDLMHWLHELGEPGFDILMLVSDEKTDKAKAWALWDSHTGPRPGGATVASLFGAAAATGWVNPAKGAGVAVAPAAAAERAAAGATAERRAEVAAMIEEGRAAPGGGDPYADAIAAIHLHEPLSLQELRTPPVVEYLVDGLIMRTVAGVITGVGGSGKTSLALDLMLHIALGKPWLGMRVIQGSSVLLSRDDGQDMLDNMLRAFISDGLYTDAQVETIRHRVAVISLSKAPVAFTQTVRGQTETTPLARSLLAAMRPIKDLRLVVLDTMRAFAGSTTNADDVATQLTTAVTLLSAELGCAALYAHHTTKAGARTDTVDQYSASGSTAITDNLRSALVLYRPELKEVADAFQMSKEHLDYATRKPQALLRLVDTRGNGMREEADPLNLIRLGFKFERTDARPKTASEQRDGNTAQVLAAVLGGSTGNNLLVNTLGRRAIDVRAEVTKLLASGLLSRQSDRKPLELTADGRAFLTKHDALAAAGAVARAALTATGTLPLA